MPIDPAFIEAVKAGIADPVGAEARGVTLADLLTKNQLGQLGLQQAKQNVALWSDPEFLQQISGVLGGGAPNLDVLGRYPQAAQGGFSALQGLAEKQADIRQKIAGAGKSDAETQKEYLSQAGHMADSVLSLADENGVVPPDKYAAVVRAAGGMGLLRLFPTPPPQPGTPEATQYLKAMRAMTPTDLAQAGYRQAQTAEIPSKLQLEQRQQAALEADKLGGEAYRDPDTNEWFAKIPNRNPQSGLRVPGFRLEPITPGAPTAPAPGSRVNINYENIQPEDLERMAADMRRQREQTRTASPTAGVTLGAPAPAAPAATGGIQIGPSGGVVTGPSLQQREQTKALATGTGTHLTELTTKASAAAQMQQMVIDMRNLEAEGIYSGGLKGTDYFKKVASIAAATGGLSAKEVERLANSESWDAQAIGLLAQAVKQFAGPRVAAAELDYLSPSKPQRIQTAAGREKVYQELYQISAHVMQEAQQAAAHLKAGNASLADFTPRFAPAKMPPATVKDLPTQGVKTGTIAIGNDGSKLYFDGRQWQPAPAGAVVR